MAFAVFPSAMMVGDPDGKTHVISIEAYEAALEHFDYAQGCADAMIMTVLMLVVIVAVTTLRSRLYSGSTGGKG
jgi:putative spermidine/putrescine transport system permease protein